MKRSILSAIMLIIFSVGLVAQNSGKQACYAYDYTKEEKIVVESVNFTIA